MHNSTNKILNNNSIKYFNGRDLNYEGGTLTLQQLSLTRILTPSLCWNLSFLDVNQLFRWFCHVLWQRRFPYRGIKGWRLTKTILNDHHTSNITKDYIVKTTRSLKAEWSSQNTLYNVQCTYCKGFQVVIWLHENAGAPPLRIHVLSTACDVISYNGQGQLCLLTYAEWRDLSNHTRMCTFQSRTTEKKAKDHVTLTWKFPWKSCYATHLRTFPFI